MILKAVVIATAVSASMIAPAFCGIALPAPPHVLPSPPPSPGPWYVGGAIVSALSLMVCAEWVCSKTHKEMSSEEAITAAAIPFSCFWWRPYSGEHIGPTCSNYRKP